MVITGLGVISPVGLNVPTAWENLISGKSGITHVSKMPPDLKTALGIPEGTVPDINPEVKIFGFVQGFDPENYMGRKEARRMDRFAQFAVAAAGEAIRDAGLEDLLRDNTTLRQETGAIIGTGNGGQITNEEQHKILLERGAGRVNVFAVPKIMLNAGSSNVALTYGLQGPGSPPVSACASGLDSIIIAYKAVRDRDATIMLAGGSEATITPTVVAGFANMKALTKDYNHAHLNAF